MKLRTYKKIGALVIPTLMLAVGTAGPPGLTGRSAMSVLVAGIVIIVVVLVWDQTTNSTWLDRLAGHTDVDDIAPPESADPTTAPNAELSAAWKRLEAFWIDET